VAKALPDTDNHQGKIMKQGIRRYVVITAGLLAASLASGSAQAQYPVVGGLLGGGTGALVGQSVGGRNGAIIGGALGAATGVAIASDYRGGAGYYAPQAYYPPQPVYYPPQRVYYYAPQPVYYYAQPRVVHSPPVYYQRYGAGWGHHYRHGHDKGRHKGDKRDWDD
jgi:hypothetical protein